MSEQDYLSSYFANKVNLSPLGFDGLQSAPGAEQDRYASHFSRDAKSPISKSSSLPIKYIPDSLRNTQSTGPSAGQERFGSHFSRPISLSLEATRVGILKSTILPSFTINSGLSAIAYTVGRVTDRIDAKDWLWPAAPVANAWWSALGRRMWYDGVTMSEASSLLSYQEKLLLGGVSVWGLRLFYHVASRSIEKGEDDARYEEDKKKQGFWDKASFTLFLPETIFQTIISLPFTLPYRSGPASVLVLPITPAYADIAYGLAVVLFASGLALETLADVQLAAHRKHGSGLLQEGVWSIVRHPNYLGDAHVHASFSLLLYSAGMLHPLALLAPVANYVFLRYIGGDAQNEAYQEAKYRKQDQIKHRQLQGYRLSKNSFWPKLQELRNPWYVSILGAGISTLLLERVIRDLMKGLHQ